MYMASLTWLFDEVNSAYEVKKTIQAYKQDPTLSAHDQNGDTQDFSALIQYYCVVLSQARLRFYPAVREPTLSSQGHEINQ